MTDSERLQWLTQVHITCSANFGVLTQNRGWVPAGQLRDGDIVMQRRFRGDTNSTPWTELQEHVTIYRRVDENGRWHLQ
jgi:hypothetical protein